MRFNSIINILQKRTCLPRSTAWVSLIHPDKLPPNKRPGDYSHPVINWKDAGFVYDKEPVRLRRIKRYVHGEDKREYIEGVKKKTKYPSFVGLLKIAKMFEPPNELKDLPDGKYDLVVIDPPWKYDAEYDSNDRRVSSPYPELDISELKKIDCFADDCVLWLWTTHKFIWTARQLLGKWGFKYKAILVWDKEKMGMGHWLRCQSEFCLLGIKGKPEWELYDERDIIRSARNNHSEKPDEFYKMIEKMCPAQKKIDIFARKKREGWEVFGDEL